MKNKSRRPSEERPGYSEEETKAIREMMESEFVPEEVKDEFIRKGAEEVRKNWSEEEKLKRMGYTNPNAVEILEWDTAQNEEEIGRVPY